MAIALPHANGSGPLSRLERPRPRIAVRHAEPTDAEALHHIMTEPEVVYWTAGLPIAPMAQTAAYATADDGARHTLVACVGEEVVGMLRLRDDDLPDGQPPPRLDPFAQLWPLHRRPS